MWYRSRYNQPESVSPGKFDLLTSGSKKQSCRNCLVDYLFHPESVSLAVSVESGMKGTRRHYFFVLVGKDRYLGKQKRMTMHCVRREYCMWKVSILARLSCHLTGRDGWNPHKQYSSFTLCAVFAPFLPTYSTFKSCTVFSYSIER